MKNNRLTLSLIFAFLFMFVASAFAQLQAQQQADLILSNGKIITVDERFSIAQAVAIRGNRIIAVGSNQEIAQFATPATRRIDLKGKAVVPGLIDNHMHLLRAANTWLRELRFDGVGTRKQALEMVRERAKSLGPGEWVFNIGGWSTYQFTDDKKPFTKDELDKIAPDNPVALQESYYQIFLNIESVAEFWDRAERARPAGFRKRVHHARRLRSSHGRDQGRHSSHAAGCCANAKSAPRAA